MAEKKKKSLKNLGGGGVFNEVINQFKLVFRLIRDPRVNPFIKLIPFTTLIYFILPDIIIGPIDDLAFIGFGLFIFVELCPPDVVEEHRAALAGTFPGQWQDSDQIDEEDIVDAEFIEEE